MHDPSPHTLLPHASPHSSPHSSPPAPHFPPAPQCHGTKSLRARPGYLRTRNLGIVDDPRDSYLCFYCGPPSKVRVGRTSVGLCVVS